MGANPRRPYGLFRYYPSRPGGYGTGRRADRHPRWDLSLPSLAETYKDYFMIGNVMSTYQTTDGELTAMYKHHYNLVTAENDMKPQYLSPVKGLYYFINGDTLIQLGGS